MYKIMAIKKYRTQAGVFVVEGKNQLPNYSTQHQMHKPFMPLPSWINEHAAKLRKYNDIVVEISHKKE